MNEVLDILKYILPSAVVFVVVYFVLKAFLDNEQKRKLLEIKMKGQSVVTPIRLQAYERIVLFLERISFNNLVMRVNKSGMTSGQLHASLLLNIRNEYEHNLSQQIYISSKAWQAVKDAKEAVIKIINSAASEIKNESSSTDLAAKILELSIQEKLGPVEKAIEYIKAEINQLF
jgi:hypothetical protein